MSNILITGGAGFIGSHVVEALLPLRPTRVVVLDNLLRGRRENMRAFANDPCFEFVEGDIRDRGVLDKCISGMDYVFHMAALRINHCAASPQEAYDVMVKATFDVAELCVKHSIKKVIYSSSASVYGLAQHFPTPETDHPYDNQTLYGAAKLWGEQLFRSYKYMFGLDYLSLRYFNVYGRRMDLSGRYTELLVKWLDCIREGRRPQVFGDGSILLDFVHVSDVARANVLAMQSDATDAALNVGSGVETSLNELVTTLLAVNKSKLIPEHRDHTVNQIRRRWAELSHAREVLGFRPKYALAEGLSDLSSWYFMEKANGTT